MGIEGAGEGSSRRGTAASLLAINPCVDHLGPYRLICEIASGGMAAVCLGVKRGVGGFEKFVAIKKLHAHLAHVPEYAAMFMDEARLAARVVHPYVCNAIDFGRANDEFYIAMEFLKGKSLSCVFRKHRKMSALFDEPHRNELLARVFANLAEGIHAIHSLRGEDGQLLGVVHRDITPHNLFVLYDGSVRVTDLGIAYAHEKLHQTANGFLKGKLSFMAPEQLQRAPSDLRSDIWSFGVAMWQLLTGCELFCKYSEADTALAVANQAVEPPSSRDPRIPAKLERIVLKALERDLNSRYQSMAEVRCDLEAYLADSSHIISNADVAAWMAKVFPTGAADTERLLWLAHQVMLNAPEGQDAALDPSSGATKLSSIVPASVVPAAPCSARQTGRHDTKLIALAMALIGVFGFAVGCQFGSTRRAEPSDRPVRKAEAKTPVRDAQNVPSRELRAYEPSMVSSRSMEQR